MKIVVDSNRIISALIKDGSSRAILCSFEHEFYAPLFLKEEFEKHKDLIAKKSGLEKKEVNELFNMIMKNISVVGNFEIEEKLKDAERIMGHIDIKDVPFVACCLAEKCDGIWSEDKHFDRQKEIKIFKNNDLL
jgi:predicted nucleic acid-binding protein